MTIELLDDSPIYEVIHYPAGEIQARIRPEHVASVREAGEIDIVSRRTDGNGMLLLAQLVSAIRGLTNASLDLIIPYLPFGRADRRFVDGDCHGLGTYAAIINAMWFRKVITLDAHSSVAKQHVNRLVDVSATGLIARAITDWAGRSGGTGATVLFPDQGAKNRYDLTPLGSDVTVFFASKVRDAATGKLTGFSVPEYLVRNARRVLIVDDLCDGGGTFLGIAKEMPGTILGLYVTHGIFSQGLEKLRQAFQVIYTTDSFQDIGGAQNVVMFDSLTAINEHRRNRKHDAAV